MNKKLTISVLRVGDVHRAILWDGIPTHQGDKVRFAITTYGNNLFGVLGRLKSSVLCLAEQHRIESIDGIHNGDGCWSIHSRIQFEEAIAWTDSLVSTGRFLSICPVRSVDGCLVARLSDSGSQVPLPNGLERAGFPVGQLGRNIFLVADHLFRTSLESFDFLGLENVEGVHDPTKHSSPPPF